MMDDKTFNEMTKKIRGPYNLHSRHPCKNLLPVGYRGQRYIVTCKDRDNKEMTVGWTNNQSGKPFVNCVNKHPAWSDPRIERMPEELITQ